MSFTSYGTDSSSSGFAGTGSTSNYSVLGITSTQATRTVTVTSQQPFQVSSTGTSANAAEQEAAQNAPQVTTVQQALSDFQSALANNPSFAATMQQQLYDAGLMSDSVYNSGQVTATDIYNAYKRAVLDSSAAGTPVDQFVTNAQQSFQAQGGPKVKLPSVRYTVPLTSYDDMSSAADAAFQKVLGHMAPTSIKQALTAELNNLEMSGKTQEARSAYSQLLGYRGLNPDGTPVTSGSDVANTAVAAQEGQASGSQQTAQAPVGGAAQLPQQVADQQGQTSTVTSGPIVTPYQAAPSSDSLAYETAMQSNPDEVKGRIMAQAAQAIAQMFSRSQ